MNDALLALASSAKTLKRKVGNEYE